MRTRYYPHEKLLKVNSLKISDLPIEIQEQINIWRANKEKGYYSKYVPVSEKIARSIENYIESDIENLYKETEKVTIPNKTHTIGFTPQKEIKINTAPQNTVKKGIENVNIPYHSNTMGFTHKRETKSSLEPQKDVENTPIPNHSEKNNDFAPNEPKIPQKDIENIPIPNHSEINSDFTENEPKTTQEAAKYVYIPNHSEKNDVLVKVEKNTLPKKVSVLCTTFCKKIGKTQTACYSILRFAEQEGIEPIFTFDDLKSLGIPTGFWSDFSQVFGHKGEYFEIRRVHNDYPFSYELIALNSLPIEAFTEVEETKLISDGAKPTEKKEIDLTDINSVNDFINSKVSGIINESKFYDTLSDVEKSFYDIVKKASELTEKPLKHVNTSISELKEKGIKKLRKNDFISKHFKITPLDQKGTLRITRK